MPNLNAALALVPNGKLEKILKINGISWEFSAFFKDQPITLLKEPKNAIANFVEYYFTWKFRKNESIFRAQKPNGNGSEWLVLFGSSE